MFDFYARIHNLNTRSDFPQILNEIAQTFNITNGDRHEKPVVTTRYDYHSEYVFVRPDGEPFTDIWRRINPIKQVAGIPDDFRALHVLRHTYASTLAGQIIETATNTNVIEINKEEKA